MARKYACSAWSLMVVGALSWVLVGCGASAVRPGTSADKPASKGAVAKPEESDSIELDASPLQGKDRAKAIAAIKLHDEKKYAEAAQLFEELLEKHPRHIAILHELALTYRTMGQHEKAIEVLIPYSGSLPPDTLSSLGSALDDAGRQKEAFHVLRWGITKYPDSGLLYSDLGVVLVRHGDVAQGMQAFHDGMAAEPSWPSNYMNSAKIKANAGERASALMEGEMFRLLEPATPRSEDMAVMLARQYHEAVGKTQNSNAGPAAPMVSLTKQPGMIQDGKIAPETAFEMGFAPLLLIAHQKGFSLKTLHRAREIFVEKWLVSSVPVSVGLRQMALFKLHRALMDAGHFEAYDHWLLAPAFPDEAEAWMRAHEAQMLAFAKFMAKHPVLTTEPRKKKSA